MTNFSLPAAVSVENLIQALPQVRHPRPQTKQDRQREWDTPIYTALWQQRFVEGFGT